MRNLKTTAAVEVHPSAEDIALCFWAMDAEEQAEFFNFLWRASAGRLPMQLQFVTDHWCLETDGRMAMSTIGEYAHRIPRRTGEQQ